MKVSGNSRLWQLALTVVVSIGLTGTPSLAAPETITKEQVGAQRKRPRVGLVLEGGGALGFAHVGLLKTLEENNIPVDLVVGTSIGSIVGAAYASGLSVAEMEKALSETQWDDLFGEKVQREGLTYRLKAGRGRELFGDTKIGFKDGSLATPAGLIVGQNILPLFQQLFGNNPSPCDFDALPLPFRAVAADLETGEAFVPSSGNLAAVVRASMSVPGVFSPVEVDGRVLVDGGIVNNLPIDIARKMGADIVIASVLDDELPKRDKLNSLLAVSGQMISLLLQQNSDASRKTLRPEDILVSIELKGYTAGDFAKAQEIMNVGLDAAKKNVEKLRHLAVSPEGYKTYQVARSRKEVPPRTIEFVKINNNSEISDDRIRRELKVKEGDTFDPEKIAADIERIFGMGYFTTVRYDVVQEDGKTGLAVDADGKDWLHQFLRLGLSLEDNLEGDSSFRLGGAYRHYDLTSKGSYGEAQVEVGKNPRIGLELYQPLADESPYFISPLITYGRTNLLIDNDGETIARYDRTEGLATLALGRELSTYGEGAVGYSRGFGDLERDIGDPTLNDFSYQIGETFARIDIDTLDTPDFPTRGFQGRFRYLASLEDLGADDTFDGIEAGFAVPLTSDRNTLILSADIATTFRTRPVERSYSLGGFLDVSGYLQNSLAASDYAQGRLLFFRRFSEVQNPLMNMGFFFGGSFELTTIQNDAPLLPDRTGIASGSVFLGADTPLLPTYFGYGFNDQQEDSFYLAIGRVGRSRR